MRISPIVLIAGLAASACSPPAPEREQAERVDPANSPAAAVTAAPGETSALAEQEGELPQAELAGIWRVTAVVPDQGSPFAADDPRIIGSLVDVLPEQLRWSYTASTAFDSDDLCFGPVAGIVDDGGYAAEVRQQVAPALVRFRAEVAGLSQPHQWLCGDGGEWGNDAAFQRLAENKLAMRWTGEVTLILTRIRKVADTSPPLPPTGAYEAD